MRVHQAPNDRPRMHDALQAVARHAPGGPAPADPGLQVGLAEARLHGVRASNAQELFNVGREYYCGTSAKGIEKDEGMAAVLFKCTADGGHMGAVFHLAFMHERGRGGLAKDEAEAVRICRRAADARCGSARLMLGHMHEKVNGPLVGDIASARRCSIELAAPAHEEKGSQCPKFQQKAVE